MKGITTIMAAMLMMLCCPIAIAVDDGIIVPVDQYTQLTLNLDKSTLGENPHYLWLEKIGGQGADYISDNWHCWSLTDTTRGACAVTSVHVGPTPSVITLRFTEQRSKEQRDLTLKGYSGTIGCGSEAQLAINSWNYWWCDPENSVGYVSIGKKLTVWLDESELRKLPFGGRWTAQLQLRQRNYGGQAGAPPFDADWTADIEINLRDNNNITIWFPQHKTATPQLDLQLYHVPKSATAGGKMTGKTQLDMCLYDGFNANSSSFQVTLSDGYHSGDRDPQLFSVSYNGIPGSDRRKRIDYRIQLNYNGEQYTLENNQPLTLSGINQGELRSVILPNIPQSVFCVPTPLTFITPAFDLINKNSGNYRGQVRVVFTPSL